MSYAQANYLGNYWTYEKSEHTFPSYFFASFPKIILPFFYLERTRYYYVIVFFFNFKGNNCRLEDKKTVSSYTQFMRNDHLKKKLCHHKEGPPLFSSTVGQLSRGPKFRFFFVSEAPFSRYDSLKF